MKQRARLLAVLLSIVMLVSMVGCANDSTDTGSTGSAGDTGTTASTTTGGAKKLPAAKRLRLLPMSCPIGWLSTYPR